jgi:hypothetical protein
MRCIYCPAVLFWSCLMDRDRAVRLDPPGLSHAAAFAVVASTPPPKLDPTKVKTYFCRVGSCMKSPAEPVNFMTKLHKKTTPIRA